MFFSACKRKRKEVKNREIHMKNAYIIYFILYFLIVRLFLLINSNIINISIYDLINKTYPYTTDWFIESLDDLDPHDKRCPLCNFPIRNRNSNSRRDDFLMTTLISKYIGFEPLIRNLRTTRTNARLIIFIDQTVSDSLTNLEKNLSIYCGINLINIGNIPKFEHFAYCFLRFYIYYDFITSYQHSINRIIFFDAMDTVFQGDPFFEGFTADMFILTLENRIVNQSSWAIENYVKYFQKIHQVNNSLYYNFSMINCGLILGGKENILIFLDVFKKRLDLDDLLYQLDKVDYIDQAILHSLVLDGDLEKRGVKISFQTVYDDYVSISIGPCGWKCKKKEKNDYSLGNYISKKTQKYPLIVHQFNRYYQFSYSLSITCPPLEKNVSLPKYIKDFPKKIRKKYLYL